MMGSIRLSSPCVWQQAPRMTSPLRSLSLPLRSLTLPLRSLTLPLRSLTSWSSSSTLPDSFVQNMQLEKTFGAMNYAPLPVVLSRGEGVHVYDTEGKKYIDCLSAFSAVNQGHCHPRIVAALTKQAQRLTLTSRAFHHDLLGRYEQYVCECFGYNRMLPMNTGVEACETAVKLARRWAYDVKGVADNAATVLFAEGNFWGRSISAVSSSSDAESYTGFGPFTPGFRLIPYSDITALAQALENDENIAAFMIEPIQGEAGVVVPDEQYLREAKRLCDQHNVLLIADEVQTGLGRTGTMLAVEHDKIRPDMIVLGKALSGGLLPASAVLADDEIMLTLKPGQHGSTYGGNPLACAVAMEALAVIEDEALADNAKERGTEFREGLESLDCEHVKLIRGRGLLNAVVIRPKGDKKAYDVCVALLRKGLLAKQTHDHIVRFAPPLVIDKEQIAQSLDIIAQVLREF